ncbi:MAG: DNA double-strand break repair nuclease NurA [Anaerolineae bacterium]|nr:DNA double-strand break repair nuclease NurA [Anaerolineae bacterium]
MALEFDKLTNQIAAMGQELATRNVTVAEQGEIAGEFLMQLNDLQAIWDQIYLAREADAGFRGAAPMDEPINEGIPLPECPDHATIFAADGSQIYPDTHGAALYWLINVGVFIYYHGIPSLPEVVTEPRLYFQDKDVRDQDGRPIPNAAINARRAVAEMQMLAREVYKFRDAVRPAMALYDGPLLSLLMGKEVTNAQALSDDYHEAIALLRGQGAAAVGYVDRPSSRFLVYTLYLMSLEQHEITRSTLQNTGLLETLTDADLYRKLLQPGERSALMIQQSPQNKEYKERYGIEHEIAFFYLNVANPVQDAYLARVEVPMAVARDKALIEVIHALLYSQCQITDRYPYVLTRADEVAVVQPHEKEALDNMIAVEMLKQRQQIETSQKLSSKSKARSGRQQFTRL